MPPEDFSCAVKPDGEDPCGFCVFVDGAVDVLLRRRVRRLRRLLRRRRGMLRGSATVGDAKGRGRTRVDRT